MSAKLPWSHNVLIINKDKWGNNYMQLKPIKEKTMPYPTIKEVSKSKLIKEILFATVLTPGKDFLPVAVISYVPNNVLKIKFFKLIRDISIFITILSSILLFANKKKINRCISENEVVEKLNKHRKNKWWIFGISIAIIVISSLAIVYLENYM